MRKPILTPRDIAADKKRDEIRGHYDDGIPLRALQRKYHMSKSEAQDIAPEEFEVHSTPDGHAGY